MNPRYLGAVIVSVALWGAAGVARGDVAPPPDYADPCDSVVLDASCRRCTAPEFKARECHASAREAGLTPRCSGWGYTMYCGEPSGQPQPQPPPPVIAEPPAPNPWPAVPAETPGPVAIAAAPESAGAESAIAAGQGSEPAPAVADKRSGCAITSRQGEPSLLVWLGLGLGLGLRRRRRPAA